MKFAICTVAFLLIMSVKCNEKQFEITYERRNLEYTRVLYNCVDKIMHQTDDKFMKSFYFNINNNLRSFLKMTRANEVSLSEFRQTAKNLREEYLLFKRKLEKNAKKCMHWSSYINLDLIVNCTEDILGFMMNLEHEQYRSLGDEETLRCMENNLEKIIWCTEKNIKRIFIPIYRPKDDPNMGRPAREQQKKKKIDLPYTSRCGTSFAEMVSCSNEKFQYCSFEGREGAVGIIKALTKYSELEQPECYDINTFATFHAIIQKLRRLN